MINHDKSVSFKLPASPYDIPIFFITLFFEDHHGFRGSRFPVSRWPVVWPVTGGLLTTLAEQDGADGS